jgi:glycosyltransferase involved in cell wall biosynthesis
MNLLLLICGLATGGAERNIVDLLPHLSAAGVTPTVVTLTDRRDGFLADQVARQGIERIDLGARKLFDPASLGRLRALISQRRFDILHSQDQYTNILAGYLRWRGPRLPTVMTRHVLAEPSDSLAGKIRARLVLWSVRTSADRLIAVSDAVRRRMMRDAHLTAERVAVILNGLDQSAYRTVPNGDALRKELGIAPDHPIVMMVGVMREGKGQEVLLDAAPALLARHPKARIVFVGAGPLLTAMQAQAAALGDAVVFVGERSDVPDLLSIADVVALPSWSEALPTVLIEAGAAGCPAVATAVGGAPEIIDDGQTGYLVAPGDAEALADRLAGLLDDDECRQRMGASARNTVAERFTLDRQARQTRDVYNAAIGALHASAL